MGQKLWAIACALGLTAAVATHLAAQQADNPFGSAPAEQPGEPGRPDPGARSYTPGEARQRIEAALDQPLREPVDFVDQPLRDVMTILAETYDIPILFDTAALDAVAVSPDVEVSINIANVTLRSALDLMLKNTGGEELTYVIDKEVLLITTEEEASSRLEVNVYRVDDLIGDGVSGSPYSADADTLIDLIVSSVSYQSWAENGTGEGEINFFPPGMVVISQSSRVQTEVQNLLDDLRRNKAAVEAATVQQRAEAAKRPISRSIAVNESSVAAEDSKNLVREALLKSVDWDAGDAEVDANDKFLLVLNDRILVRHVPSVVAQVQHSVKDLNLAPPRGISRGTFGTGISKADLEDQK